MHFSQVAMALIALSGCAALGLAMGQIKVAGIRFGVGGALFAGLLIGHFGLSINPDLLYFARELGLVLFVYAIGVSVGPGFFNSFRKQGLALNGIAMGIVLLGTLTAIALHFALDIDLVATLGMLSGAVTNTPSLASGAEALAQMGIKSDVLGQAYAVAYPFGIIGILISMLLLRLVFGKNLKDEEASFLAARAAENSHLETINLEVINPALAGMRIRDLPELKSMDVVLSRVMHDYSQHVVSADDVLNLGDVVLAVGPSAALASLGHLFGKASPVDLKAMSSQVTFRRVVVTKGDILGKTLGKLDIRRTHHVVVSRLSRGGHELTPHASTALQFGDILTLVGDEANLDRVTTLMGNSGKALQETQLVSVFIGITLGLVLGSVPFWVPGLPAPIQLGLAGGPLVVAILLSRIGRIGKVVWYMPPPANHFMKDFGIALFLAAVGLKSGAGFVDTLVTGDGLLWIACGAIITLLPLLIMGAIATVWLKTNYLTLCGVLSGAMTDPPALAFAQGLSRTEAATLAYASVYPLVMVARVIAPQLVVLLLLA